MIIAAAYRLPCRWTVPHCGVLSGYGGSENTHYVDGYTVLCAYEDGIVSSPCYMVILDDGGNKFYEGGVA